MNDTLYIGLTNDLNLGGCWMDSHFRGNDTPLAWE